MKKAIVSILSFSLISLSNATHAVPNLPMPDFSQNVANTFCGNPPPGTGCTFGHVQNKIDARWGVTQDGKHYYQELYTANESSRFPANEGEYITCTSVFDTPDPGVSCVIQCGASSQLPDTCYGKSPQFTPDHL